MQYSEISNHHPARLLAALMQDERNLRGYCTRSVIRHVVVPPVLIEPIFYQSGCNIICSDSGITFIYSILSCRHSGIDCICFFFFFNVLHFFFQQQVCHSSLFHAPAINKIVSDYQHHHHQVQVQIRIIHRPPRQHSIPLSPPPLHNTEMAQTKLMKSYPSSGNGVEL
jgi:hypothetical protein